MIRIERSRDIEATPEQLWEVLADFGALASVSYTHLTLPTNREV